MRARLIRNVQLRVLQVLFGGDWPVMLQATSYPRWVETLEWTATGASEDERRKLFRDNAIEFYRLG